MSPTASTTRPRRAGLVREARLLLATVPLLGARASAQERFDRHLDQHRLVRLVELGQDHRAFLTAFDGGDALFHFLFTEVDGVGANVGGGRRFTRIPRMDLNGSGEWANHFPARVTGPNEQSCTACHAIPTDDGAGGIAHDVVRDPLRSGDPSKYIERQTPHLFGSGAVQRLAEEMTEDLQAIRRRASAQACATGLPVTRALVSKSVSFGTITARPGATVPCDVVFDTSGLVGISTDLVVRPFGWKGDTTSLRAFTRSASHGEIGMQPTELVGPGVDGDFDGVADELTVGDVTGLVVYTSGQPRPLTTVELDRYGLVDPLTPAQRAEIRRGREIFEAIQCTYCHVPTLHLDDPVFSEPSTQAPFRDTLFPDGEDPAAQGVTPLRSVRYDLTRDLPDNVVTDPTTGREIARLGNFPRDEHGRAIVELYGDLRRHDMGPGLAEPIDEAGTGASSWLTENLWGVGSTAPYLHDGRAPTLEQAILLHGGESQASRDTFGALPPPERNAVIAFLKSLVLRKIG
jgi:hypothetical protein